MRTISCLLALLVLGSTNVVRAQIPRNLSLQGLLTDDSGSPVPDATYTVTFRLYSGPEGGIAFWWTTMPVQTVDGIYDVVLGPISDTVPFDNTYWLSLQISPDPEMTQRTELTATPYSLNSSSLDLPFSKSASSVNALFELTNTRTGPATAGAGRFVIDNALNPGTALYGYTNGTGRAITASSAGSATAMRAYSSASGRSIYAENGGTGPVAEFQITNASNSQNVITAQTVGSGDVVNASTSGGGDAVHASTSSSGHAVNASSTSSGHAVHASTSGSGNAGRFVITSGSNNNAAVYGETQGTSRAGHFRITNSSNNLESMAASTTGGGPAVSGYTVGTGNAGFFRINNTSSDASAVYAETNGRVTSAGHFVATSGTKPGSSAVKVEMKGQGHAGLFLTENAANTDAAVYIEHHGAASGLISKNYGTGWAGRFWGAVPTAHGIYVSVYTGQTGLEILHGSKSAVVPTTKGARALYSEEATEVWFSDYGAGQLQRGRASVSIDPLFAETVNLSEPYHVFVQLNDADCMGLAVVNKTQISFDVVELSGGLSSAEFSYRIVGKRRGFEGQRLEHRPWAEDDPNLKAQTGP